jgi:3-isopropylmalate dehydratase small subunit
MDAARIGASFGDVYRGNCLQKGVLTIVLPQPVINGLFTQLHTAPGAAMTVDLPHQVVIAPDGATHPFDIDVTRKERLLKGLDAAQLAFWDSALSGAMKSDEVTKALDINFWSVELIGHRDLPVFLEKELSDYRRTLTALGMAK